MPLRESGQNAGRQTVLTKVQYHSLLRSRSYGLKNSLVSFLAFSFCSLDIYTHSTRSTEICGFHFPSAPGNGRGEGLSPAIASPISLAVVVARPQSKLEKKSQRRPIPWP